MDAEGWPNRHLVSSSSTNQWPVCFLLILEMAVEGSSEDADVVDWVHVAALFAGELVSYWNLPHFSFSSTDPALRDRQTYGTLVRLISPFNHLAAALHHVLRHFSVSSISVCIYRLRRVRCCKCNRKKCRAQRIVTTGTSQFDDWE